MTDPALSCSETFRRLDDYLDRELRPDEMTAVEAHLRRCTECAGEFDVERDLLTSIRDKLARLRVPPELRARIAAQLDLE